ncbi:MAG: DUF2304 domain-containing protein [Nitrospinae bacterium]|nr:DUF2304 domain-containing protein [Nitrospinota bacterium]
MPLRQQIFAILISIVIFIVIIELVRKRKLREEFSLIWLLTGFLLFILAIWYDLLLAITSLIGASLATSTLFFFGLVFLILINLYYSIKLSAIANQMKNLSQEVGILKSAVSSQQSAVRKKPVVNEANPSEDSDTVKE